MKRALLGLLLAFVPALASAQAPYYQPPTQALAPPIVVFPGSASQVLAVDGSVSAPSVSFAGDTGTGFYRAGAGDVRFATSGVAQFRIVANNIVLRDAEALSWSSTSDPGGSADTTLARGTPGRFTFTGTAGPMLQLGGTTSSFAGLKGNGTTIEAKTADDSAYANVTANGFQFRGNINNLGTLVISATAPTISSGFGTSASVVNPNGTAAFTVNVGTGGAASSGVIGLPAASHGWFCDALLENQLPTIQTKQSASTTTTVTITNYTVATGATAAWAASQIVVLSCFPY
jgi:hypothetical protein